MWRLERAAKLQALTKGSPAFRQTVREYRNRINHATRKDYRDYVEEVTTSIEKAAQAGNAKAVWAGVKKLGGKGEGSSYGVQPQIHRGKELKRPSDLAEAWHEVAASKFGCTPREELRQAMAELGPAEVRRGKVPTREILGLCLAALKKSKAVGLDGIPAEAFQNSDAAKEDLFALVTQIWIQEQVPEDMSKSEMIPFYKNKGSSNDFTKYRMIGLINHAMKMVSTILLFYLLRETTDFFPESQSGFRSGKTRPST